MTIEQMREIGLPACHASWLALDSFRIAALRPSSRNYLLQTHVQLASRWDGAAQCFSEETIDAIARDVCRRVRGKGTQATLAHLHEYLFENAEFHGTGDDFDHLDGYLISKAIKRKSAIPTILCLIYKSICDRIGLYCWGVPVPGKFLCGLQDDGGMMLIDVAERGRLLSMEEARGMGKSFLEAMGMEDDGSDWFVPCEPRNWLTRSMQNLIGFFGKRGRYADVGMALELEMVIWPDQVKIYRDLSLVLARMGNHRAVAAKLLASYLISPESIEDKDRSDLFRLQEVLEK